MSFSIVRSRTLNGISAPPVEVEVHLANGLPAFAIVGLAETAIKESRDRVRSAIQNSNFEFPQRRITVNLAPADLPKEGAGFDLPIAIGILVASDQLRLSRKDLENHEFIGELALDGQLRSVAGILPVAHAVYKSDHILAIPDSSVNEASIIRGLQMVSAPCLTQLTDNLVHKRINPTSSACLQPFCTDQYADFSEVKGQHLAKRAIEIAAAGNHNLLMIGPPGCGKTMLASRLPGILPAMDEIQAIETASIQSVSHNGFDISDWCKTPIRSPHHSCSPAALIGGGTKPVPGEVSMAHNGVLFLDELPEFDRRALEMLREPLETGYVNISRVNHHQQYLAKFMLIAAANPCQCGYYGSVTRACRCSPGMLDRYRAKLSGPLIDRFDMHIELAAIRAGELIGNSSVGSSKNMAERVKRARSLQLDRQGKPNAELTPKEIDLYLNPQHSLLVYIGKIVDSFNLTARSFHRILKLGRTIADCNGKKTMNKSHVNESLHYRSLDRK